MRILFAVLLSVPSYTWSQDCHHRAVTAPAVQTSLPGGFITTMTAVQDRLYISPRQNSNDKLICEWLRNSRRGLDPNSDKVPEWNHQTERTFTTTSLPGRAFSKFGSALIIGMDRVHGYSSGRMEEIQNELPVKMAQFERTPNLQRCAPLFQIVADKCQNGSPIMADLYGHLRCGLQESAECMRSKCGIEITSEDLEVCRNFIPPSSQHWARNQNLYKETSFFTGLYLIKNEPRGRNHDSVRGETAQQRLVRRSINHALTFIDPKEEIPGRVDTPLNALQRGGTNCLGYALMINSAVRYAAGSSGVRTEIVTHVPPAHAWSRIHLTQPRMSFDADGSQYPAEDKPFGRATYPFLPLPPRNQVRRSACQTEEAPLPFCTANVSDTESIKDSESTAPSRRTFGRSGSNQ